MTSRVLGLLVAGVCAAGLVACAPDPVLSPWEKARAENQSRSVASRFADHPVVIDDPHGFVTSHMLFDTSEVAVVVDETTTAALRGASVAMVVHAPMLVYTADNHAEVVEELRRLKAHTILTVGMVALAPTTGYVNVVRDPGGMDALGEMTALQFHVHDVEDVSSAVYAVADTPSDTPTWLRATWADPVVGPRAKAFPVPGQGPRDAGMSPKVIATPETAVAPVVNARSFGASVQVVPHHDPRVSHKTLEETIGLAEEPLLALGKDFGTDAELQQAIREAEQNLYTQ